MKQVLTFIILLLAVHSFAAAPYNDWWQKANKLYEQKEYDSAANYYERIAALNPSESSVYYNLGNTYYKLNDIGHAVLNYERALRYAPGDKQTEDNLALTQSRITNRIYSATDIFFVKWWNSIVNGKKAGTWATISLITFLLLIGIAIAKRLNKLNIAFAPQILGIGWGLCALFLVFAFASAKNRNDRSKAVVMQNDSPFYVSPQQTKAQAYISEGTTVKMDGETQGWVEVTLPDGRTGWMQLSILSKV